MRQVSERQWLGALGHLIARSHLSQPDQLAESIEAALTPLGLTPTVYLIDYEQETLRPLPVPGRVTPPPLPVDASLPGRAFIAVEPVAAPGEEPRRLWLPTVDGTDRLGVIALELAPGLDPTDPVLQQQCLLFAGLVGHLIVAKLPYGDHLESVRRSQSMTTGAELLSTALPPLTASTDRLTISAVLQPCYDVGGDGFDYTIDGAAATFALLDAMGRGARAGLACCLALAAMRAARRAGDGLLQQARAVDAELAGQFGETRFVTAILAHLDLDTGRLSYLNAGQPPPLLLRGNRLVRELTDGKRMPLGVEDPAMTVAHEPMQPGDRLLLYSDGVTQARTPAGDLFGVPRLVELAEQHHQAGLPAPETLRRLAQAAVADRQEPVDDATLLLAAWSPAEAARTMPGPPWPSPEGDG